MFSNIEYLMVLSIFMIVLTILVYMNCRNIDFTEIDKKIEKEINLQKDKILKEEVNKRDNGFVQPEINIKNRSGVDITNINNPELSLGSVMQDLNELIGIVMVNELYSSELTGGLNVSRDDSLKNIVNTITAKTLSSMSNNFRAKIYLFITENLLVETIHSNVTRRVLAQSAKRRSNMGL